VAALVCGALSGCGEPDKAPAKRTRDSAIAKCTGNVCRVRVTCKGRVSVRPGAAPVRIRTSKSALVTTIILDFAGSRDDTVIRC
jgi:hypothetical protein